MLICQEHDPMCVDHEGKFLWLLFGWPNRAEDP